jgi:hypothetical protein
VRIRSFALPALLLLAACDAGSRGVPGGDNLLESPSLAVTSPAAEQVLATREPLAMFDVHGATTGARGDRLVVVVDGGEARSWPEPTRPFPLGALDPGTHLLRATIVRSDGRAYRGPRAFVTRRFHVERAKSDVFPLSDPAVTLVAPLAEAPRSGGVADAVVTGATLGKDGHRLRLALDGRPLGAREGVATAEPVPLGDLAAGKHVLTAELVGPDGAAVRSPLARVERAFEVR